MGNSFSETTILFRKPRDLSVLFRSAITVSQEGVSRAWIRIEPAGSAERWNYRHTALGKQKNKTKQKNMYDIADYRHRSFFTGTRRMWKTKTHDISEAFFSYICKAANVSDSDY